MTTSRDLLARLRSGERHGPSAPVIVWISEYDGAEEPGFDPDAGVNAGVDAVALDGDMFTREDRDGCPDAPWRDRYEIRPAGVAA